MPIALLNLEIDELCIYLADMEIITTYIQSDNLTISDVRDLFYTGIEDIPNMKIRIFADVVIIKDKNFESSIDKIQQGRINLK